MSKRPRDPDFTDLPTDLIRSIGPYLPTSDYSAFRGTSRAVHAQLPTCKTLIPQVSSCVADKQLPYPQCEDYCYQYASNFSFSEDKWFSFEYIVKKLIPLEVNNQEIFSKNFSNNVFILFT